MRFDLNTDSNRKEAQEYLDKLLQQRCMVDISKKFNRRTYSQNNYVHLLLSYCALESGETLDYFKQVIWKQLINPDIFKTLYTNTKNGKERLDWKSSADIDTKEMTIAVERLIAFAAKQLSLSLPTPSDVDALRKIENEVENNRKYL